MPARVIARADRFATWQQRSCKRQYCRSAGQGLATQPPLAPLVELAGTSLGPQGDVWTGVRTGWLPAAVAGASQPPFLPLVEPVGSLPSPHTEVSTVPLGAISLTGMASQPPLLPLVDPVGLWPGPQGPAILVKLEPEAGAAGMPEKPMAAKAGADAKANRVVAIKSVLRICSSFGSINEQPERANALQVPQNPANV